MNDQSRTKQSLIEELDSLRKRVAELERAEEDRKRMEEALRESEGRYKRLLDSVTDYIYTVQVKDGRPVATLHGPGCAAVTGYTSEDYQANSYLWHSMIYTEDRDIVTEHAAKVIAGEAAIALEHRIVHRDGSVRWVQNTHVPHYDEHRRLVAYDGLISNITERKRLEEERLEMERRLLHAQRLESLGIMAGGIAHDFNNLLMVILGNLEMTLLALPPSSRIYPFIEASLSATTRAADITRQMLAYSGKGGFMLKPLDITLLVKAMKAMLKTSISKTVVFRRDLSPLLPSVMADAGQMQQVVLNLIINASEAIGEKTGVVILRTGVLDCDDVYLGHSRLEEKPPPGRFAFIEVSDTGCGMDEETQYRLFDPFFTTKFPGRGLGMSALLGIVRGHKGAIMVDSEVGKETTIRVLFPAMAAEEMAQKPSVEPASTPSEKAALPSFSGTILLVDDEEELRDLCKTILECFGFRVLTASDGEECVKVFSAHADEITCVILDLTMPKMDGAEAFIELNRLRPDVPVILSSGYDKTEATRRFTDRGPAGFIQKPYKIRALRNELERVLKGV